MLLLGGLVLRIYTSSDFFLHTWDERYHALVAKNIINHPFVPTLYENPILPYDYKNWTANHIWLHKQPLSLWFMAASLYLFGINEIAVRIPSILLSTIGIGLTYLIGNYFFNKKVGYLAAFFFSINGLIIELASGRVATDHIDIFFMFFIELAVVFSILYVQKQKMLFNLLAGLCLGAALLSKSLVALIVIPIWLFVVIDSKKFNQKEICIQLILLISICLMTYLPWQIYINTYFPLESAWESSFNFKHFTEVIEERTGPFYYFFEKLRINYGELIYLPLIWFVWKTLNNLYDKKRLALLIWIMVPLIFFSLAKTKMQAYILFIAPALFIVTADFFFIVYEYQKLSKPKWIYNLILLLLLALPIRYTIERVKPFNHTSRNPDWAIDLRKLNEQKILKGVLFNYDRPIEAMFYANLTAYQLLPDSVKLNELINKGYTIIINDDGNLPELIKRNNKLIIESIRIH